MLHKYTELSFNLYIIIVYPLKYSIWQARKLLFVNFLLLGSSLNELGDVSKDVIKYSLLRGAI